ncbi:MAG: hypothetical protein P8Y45_00150 [Exilibacterium sp.]
MKPSTVKYKISLITDSEAERSKFFSLFKVINPRLMHYWEITDAGEADFVIVDTDYKKSHIQKLKNEFPNSKLVVYTQTPPPENILYLLKPVRAGNLINFLNHTCGSLPTRLTVVGNIDSSQAFIPEYLLSRIKMSSTSMLWTTQSVPVIGYCKRDKVIVLNHRQFNSWFDRDKNYLFNRVRSGGEASNGEIAKLENTEGFITYDFEQFSWLTYLNLSNNVLHGDLTGNTTFGLYKWPDFTRLPHTPKDLVLTAALMKQPMTAQQLTTHTHVNRRRVIGFLNACHSVGQLKVIHNSPLGIEKNLAYKAPSELIGKIMKKIIGSV